VFMDEDVLEAQEEDDDLEEEEEEFLLSPADEKLLDQTYALVSIPNPPTWYMNASYPTLFKDEDRGKLDALFEAAGVELTPSLEGVLFAPEPPSFEFFKNTPPAAQMTWAVYNVCMEMAGAKDALYIGSGTDQTHGGATHRLNIYRPYLATTPEEIEALDIDVRSIEASRLPEFVKSHLKLGYHISHIGVLCSSPIPPPALVAKTRGMFLAFEATFTIMFWACIEWITDAALYEVRLWKRSSVG
jgi:hypothetical protein